ncbi:MAG: serine/threonine protein kinase, partial [Deltaproteobacteria bacterium]|nr:serine/threonine protein kinase [Deltaproteobacteria bacterium]
MICAACGELTPQAPCTTCGDAPLLDQRYCLEEVLGQGPQGTTYRATSMADGSAVVVKELRVQAHLADKRRELFVREAHVLRQLDHPAIPRYIDDFEVRSGRWRTLCLVQAFIEGASLASIALDHRYEQDEVLEITAALLDILTYLHELSPPVVHRDIKPSNVIRRSDGGLSLVDFGAVRDALKDPDLGGSTVAGTFGYMAPEQFAGDASPRTDLYGVGALAVALLTRREPHTLLDLRNRMDWEVHATPHPALAVVLHRLLAPDPEARPESARLAQSEVKWAREEMRANPEIAALARRQPQELVPSTPLVVGGALLLILAAIAALLMQSL